MMKNRIEKLEKITPPPRKEDNGLDKLSVSELEELEVLIIKRDNGESFTDEEQERINIIVAKTKSD